MNHRLAIRGVGAVGGFGCGKKALTAALLDGGQPNGEIDVVSPDGNLVFPAYLADAASVYQFFPKRKLRRADKFSKLAVLGAFLALQDADLSDVDMTRVGIAVGTGYGGINSTFRFIDSAIEYGDAGASPTIFSYSGNSGALSTTTITLGITGPSLTVSQFELSVPSALISARQWLLDGHVDVLLMGGLDEYCEVLGYCRERFFGAANCGPIRPLDFDAQSAVVGEGSAFLALTRDEGQAPKYGTIDDVVLGRAPTQKPSIPSDAWAILGADGHRICGRHYAHHFASHHRSAAYAPIYGSMPAGVAFDLVVAALAMRSGKVEHTPGCTNTSPFGDEPVDLELGGSGICCVKFDRDGQFGLIRMSANKKD